VKLKYWLATVAGLVLLGLSYGIGYWNGPGPYIPTEDSFDYTNHHCVPLTPEEGR
jgi:hypothetical protein